MKVTTSYPTLNPPPPATSTPDLAALLAPLLQAQMAAQAAFAGSNATHTKEKKDERGGGTNPTLNMSPQE